MIKHMVIAPGFLLRLPDAELVEWLGASLSDAQDLRAELGAMADRGAVVPQEGCDNFDELGRCLGHSKPVAQKPGAIEAQGKGIK